MNIRQYVRVLTINALARRGAGVTEFLFQKEMMEEAKALDPKLHSLMMKVEVACHELENYIIAKMER